MKIILIARDDIVTNQTGLDTNAGLSSLSKVRAIKPKGQGSNQSQDQAKSQISYKQTKLGRARIRIRSKTKVKPGYTE